MAVFRYEAIDRSGKNIKGMIDADSERVARQRLRAKGIFPSSVKEANQKFSSKNIVFDFRSKRISTSLLAVTTRQFATLIAAGMPVVEALKALIDQIEHQTLKQITSTVCDDVNEGSNLADALRKHPQAFPRLYVNMVAAGEASGTLEMILERLAELFEAESALKKKIQGALFYPVLMLVLCVGAVVLMLTVVVPEITAIFEERGAALPLPTQIVITLSSFMQEWFLLILAVCIALGIGISRYIKTEKGKAQYDSFLLKLPIFGNLVLKIGTSRLARNLGSMLSSGVQLLNALTIVKNIIGNTVLEKAVEEAAEGVREGQSLAKELKKSNTFPSLLVHMIAIGEKSGNMESMLNRAADNFETEVDAFVGGITTILEPLLILFLATIVGGILFSVMLPMLEMSSLAG